MARARVDFNLKGVKQHALRLNASEKRAKTVMQRAASTLERRLGPETTRVIASDVLNLPARRISPHIDVSRRQIDGNEIVAVSASRVRLPLADFNPRYSRTDGATVTTWLDQGAKQLPHVFKRRDKKGAWQRIPASGVAKFRPKGGPNSSRYDSEEAPSGLVRRLPIIERKGPSLHRVFVHDGRFAGHVDIRPKLSAFVEQTLSLEIARLIRATR